MANYIFTATNQYPVSESEIRAANNQTSFPSPFVPPEGYELVFPAPIPSYDQVSETYREIAPELINGHYEQRFEVVPKFSEYTDAEGVIHSVAEQLTAQAEAARLASIPVSVTMRQARLALLNAGILTQANDAINTMTGIEGDAARIEWEFSNEVRRDSALVSGIGSSLNLTNVQVDDLFIAASVL